MMTILRVNRDPNDGREHMLKPTRRLHRRPVAGRALKLARARIGLSQEAAGELLDVSHATVRSYERQGAPAIVAYAALGLLIAHGVPVDEARGIVQV